MSACRIPKEELYVHPAFDLKSPAQNVLASSLKVWAAAVRVPYTESLKSQGTPM